jgi:hypothetical protein
MGVSEVAIWCLAVARAAPSVGYLRLPLTGHLEALSIAGLPAIPSSAIEMLQAKMSGQISEAAPISMTAKQRMLSS